MTAAEHVKRQVAVAIVIDPMGGGQRSALAERDSLKPRTLEETHAS